MDYIEGVDYIFDRYAYLKLEPTATQQEIHKAVKLKRAGLHDDKIRNLDDELKENARRVRAAVERCAEVLEDDAKRKLYDQRLEHFKATAPQLVTSNPHTVPFDPTRERFDFEGLLHDKDDSYDLLEAKARELTHYDPAADQKAAARYKKNPKNARTRREYSEQLTLRLNYLTAMEQVVWLGAGFNTAKKTRGLIQAPEDYTSASDAAIADTRTRVIAETVGLRKGMVALGMASPPLLLEYNGSASSAGEKPAMPDDLTEKIIDTVREKFDLRTQRIRDNAQAKADTLQALLELSPTYIFRHVTAGADNQRSVHLFRPAETGEPRLMVTFNFLREGHTMRSTDTVMPEAENRPGLSEVKKAAKSGPPSVGIVHSRALEEIMDTSSFYMEANHALNLLEAHNERKTARRRAKTEATPAQS